LSSSTSASFKVQVRSFGTRVIGTVPLGAWETLTFVGALRHNEMTAPMVIEGAMTDEMFRAYVSSVPGSTEQFARSCHSSVLGNAPTTSGMRALLPFDWEPL
jgi:hypothetical protein